MDTLLAPLLYIVSWIMIGWHYVFSTLLGIPEGPSWTLSIIGLVVVIRILLIPLFVRQIKASRAMQLIQPQVRELQKKYGHDRERMGQEMMKLYQENGTNPFSSCLPVLLQAPFFFSLFRVLDGIARGDARGAFTSYPDLFASAGDAAILGAPLSVSFLDAPNAATRVLAVVMVVLMTATTFLTQRQLMRKNMPASALEGPFAQQQKILLYVLPLVFAFSGVFFPLGVVLYWLTSNFWTMGQQFYVIRRMPAPGTPAEEAYKRRLEARAGRKGLLRGGHRSGPASAPATGPTGTAVGDGSGGAPPSGAGPGPTRAKPPGGGTAGPPPAGRAQPRRTTRAQRKKRP